MSTIYDECSKDELLQIVSEMQNDLNQACNEIRLLNKQIDKLIEENKQLKLRNKMLTKIGLNSIYGLNCCKNHCVYTDIIETSHKVIDELKKENNNMLRNIEYLCDENVRLRHELNEVQNNDSNY